MLGIRISLHLFSGMFGTLSRLFLGPLPSLQRVAGLSAAPSLGLPESSPALLKLGLSGAQQVDLAISEKASSKAAGSFGGTSRHTEWEGGGKECH